MTRYVALLRGINVGKTKRMAMADLRAMLGELGYENPRTLLQSGNAVFDASGSAPEVQAEIEGAIAQAFGFEVDVVLRSAKQIDAVLNYDPLGATADDDAKYIVCFLSGKPDPKAVKELKAQDFTPELLAIKGTELYAWCPENIHASPMLKVIGKAGLADHMTVRNIRTARKIAELAAAD